MGGVGWGLIEQCTNEIMKKGRLQKVVWFRSIKETRKEFLMNLECFDGWYDSDDHDDHWSWDHNELGVYSWRRWQGRGEAVSMKVEARWTIIFLMSSLPLSSLSYSIIVKVILIKSNWFSACFCFHLSLFVISLLRWNALLRECRTDLSLFSLLVLTHLIVAPC